MDSIVNHYAAKRQVPNEGLTKSRSLYGLNFSQASRSSAPSDLISQTEARVKRPRLAASTSSNAVNLAALPKSSSVRNLAASSSRDRANHETPSAGGLSSARSTTNTKLTVDRASLAASKDHSALNVCSTISIADRKRQYELAKARRKSQAQNGKSRRFGSAPTNGSADGPKSPGSSALVRSDSTVRLGVNEQQHNHTRSPVITRPPFIFGSPGTSLKHDPKPRKKFDLQASLSRPLSWQLNLREYWRLAGTWGRK